jgi:hypothetical protein
MRNKSTERCAPCVSTTTWTERKANVATYGSRRNRRSFGRHAGVQRSGSRGGPDSPDVIAEIEILVGAEEHNVYFFADGFADLAMCGRAVEIAADLRMDDSII